MRIRRAAIAALLLFSFFIQGAQAQLVVNSNAPYNNINYLVNNVLLGNGVVATNITYTGTPVSLGYFNGLNSNINLDSGIIITSGDIAGAVGPNNIGSQTTANSTPGDTQLEQITNNTTNGSFDAAVIEFDFLANSDTVKFEYVFGSEEYMEWVNTGFNDAFAFIISGVSVVLPPANIALIPSPPAPPNTPVTIDNVNLGSYPQYYFDNETPPGLTVQYDGFTKVLTAIFPVQCGQTYHIKLVVADIGDQAYDSGVFLKAGSFSSVGSITVSSNISYGSLNDSTLYEGCGQACIIVDRGIANMANPDTVTLSFTGIAVNGVDITLLPDTIFFLPAQSTVTICIQGLADALVEGPEDLTLLAILLGNSVCSSGDTASLTMYIDDHTPLTVSAIGDTVICTGTSVPLSGTASGGVQPVVYAWTPSAGLNNPNISNPTASPTMTTMYVVSVSDSCNAPLQHDTVTVTVLPPGPVLVNAPNITVCIDGTPVTFAATVTGGAIPYSYAWSTVSGNGAPAPANSQNPSLIPTGPGTYFVSVVDRCGKIGLDSVRVIIEDCITIIPNVISADGNGLNDFFVIKNLDHFPGSRLIIYDRWGIKLLDNPDYQNNWDAHGYVDGTYYFVLYRSDGEVFPGYITVLRQ